MSGVFDKQLALAMIDALYLQVVALRAVVEQTEDYADESDPTPAAPPACEHKPADIEWAGGGIRMCRNCGETIQPEPPGDDFGVSAPDWNPAQP